MDHVLIDMEERRMLGRGSHAECLHGQEVLGEQFRYHVVYCNEAKGFSVFTHEVLADLWLKAKGYEHAPLVQFGLLCKAMHDEAQKVGPLSVYLANLNEENAMSNVAEQNGVKWPQRGASARVFEIAQQISTQKKDFASKDEVVVAATAEGINAGTAGTQYSAWLRYWQGPVNEPAAPVAPTAPAAPQAPVAPTPPMSHQMPQAVVQGVHEAVHAAQVARNEAPPTPVPPVAFNPPATPPFSAPQQPAAPSPFTPPAAPQQPAQVPAQPFAQPSVAQEVAVAGNATDVDPKQRVNVEIGMHVSVSLLPALAKLEKLLQVLRDAQADFGD